MPHILLHRSSERLQLLSSGAIDASWTSCTPMPYVIFHAMTSRCSNFTIPLGPRSLHLSTPSLTSFGDTYVRPVSVERKQSTKRPSLAANGRGQAYHY